MNCKDEVIAVIQNNWPVSKTFTPNDIYKFKNEFSEFYPDNSHIKDEIRQTLQYLKDNR